MKSIKSKISVLIDLCSVEAERQRETWSPHSYSLQTQYEKKVIYKQAHTCMLMHTTRGPPNFKAGDLDPKGRGGIEKIFRQSLDNVLKAASGV